MQDRIKQSDTKGARRPNENALRVLFARLRARMAGELLQVIGSGPRDRWKTCPLRDCRRHRLCAAPGFVCHDLPLAWPATEREISAMPLGLKCALNRRLAALERAARG